MNKKKKQNLLQKNTKNEKNEYNTYTVKNK